MLFPFLDGKLSTRQVGQMFSRFSTVEREFGQLPSELSRQVQRLEEQAQGRGGSRLACRDAALTIRHIAWREVRKGAGGEPRSLFSLTLWFTFTVFLQIPTPALEHTPIRRWDGPAEWHGLWLACSYPPGLTVSQ